MAFDPWAVAYTIYCMQSLVVGPQCSGPVLHVCVVISPIPGQKSSKGGGGALKVTRVKVTRTVLWRLHLPMSL